MKTKQQIKTELALIRNQEGTERGLKAKVLHERAKALQWVVGDDKAHNLRELPKYTLAMD